MDNVFLAIYIMELILKLYALGSLYFSSGWNIMGRYDYEHDYVLLYNLLIFMRSYLRCCFKVVSRNIEL